MQAPASVRGASRVTAAHRSSPTGQHLGAHAPLEKRREGRARRDGPLAGIVVAGERAGGHMDIDTADCVGLSPRVRDLRHRLQHP